MRQNKYSKMSEEEQKALSAQYLKEDQAAFDQVQKSREEQQERMNNLQRLASAYRRGLKLGGKAEAERMMEEEFDKAKKEREAKEASESQKHESSESQGLQVKEGE